MNVNRTQRTFSDLTLDVSLLRNGSGLWSISFDELFQVCLLMGPSNNPKPL
jgi:hypothetical protein